MEISKMSNVGIVDPSTQPDGFLKLFRELFSEADNSSKKNTSKKFGLDFAEDDDVPTKILYIPFSWTQKGKKNNGYLISDADTNKIYGLESNEGFSYNVKGTKDLMESLTKDRTATFTYPNDSSPLYFPNIEGYENKLGDAMGYLWAKGTPYGDAVDYMLDKEVSSNKLNGNFVSTFIKNLRKAYLKGMSEDDILKWTLDFGEEQFPELFKNGTKSEEQQQEPQQTQPQQTRPQPNLSQQRNANFASYINKGVDMLNNSISNLFGIKRQ